MKSRTVNQCHKKSICFSFFQPLSLPPILHFVWQVPAYIGHAVFSFNKFSALEAHIMYLTVSSSFLISFVMGGSGLSRVIKFLNAHERPEQGD